MCVCVCACVVVVVGAGNDLGRSLQHGARVERGGAGGGEEGCVRAHQARRAAHHHELGPRPREGPALGGPG